MPGASTIANVQEALKNYYLDGFRYQLNTANPVLAVMERDTESVQGDNIVMALRYGRQGGIGNRPDDGGSRGLPTPNARKTKQATWHTKNIFARIQISDKTMRASRGRLGAFASLLEADLEDAMNDAKDDVARQIYGDGSGKMAVFTGATGATQAVDNIQYFVEGMLIDVINPSDGTVKASDLEVLAVDDVANTITLSSSVTTDSDDVAVRAGNWQEELTGFGKVFTTDNTLYNVNRASAKWFNPTVIPVNGEISEIILQKGTDDVDRKAGGKVNFYSTSYGVRRAYQNLLLATKQITNVMQLEGGYEVLTYNNKPFTADKYAPAGIIDGLDMTTWRLYQLMDFDWLQEDGDVLERVSGKPVWEATLARYCDLGCSKPKGNFRMTGITEH